MVYQKLLTDAGFGEKKLALLIDPDKQNNHKQRIQLTKNAQVAQVDYILVGGSLLYRDSFQETVRCVKQETNIPVLLFPGSAWQISMDADALLFLSLISGRYSDLLIGQQVQAAPILHETSLEVLSTGYMLIDGGDPTTASYISQTAPIPANKPEIATATGLAGKYMGMQLLYMDAGSGAKKPVSDSMIRAVKQKVGLPLLVGGGIRTAEQALQTARAGADIVVIGTVVEQNPSLLLSITQAVHSALHYAG